MKTDDISVPMKMIGVVALLDFLGVSTFDLRGCEKFLSKRLKVLECLERAKKEIAEFDAVEISVRTFGDSILLTWPTGLTHSDDVLVLGDVLKAVFHICIENQILVRGAISAGEFIETEGPKDSVVLGPAVADVASWYEAANWSGIVATPRTGHLLDFREKRCICEGEPDPALIRRTFVKYTVPLKLGFSKGEKLTLWCVAWPEWLTRIPASDAIRAAAFYEKFSFFASIPLGTEIKYSNTLEFFEWYWKEVHPKVKDIDPLKKKSIQ